MRQRKNQQIPLPKHMPVSIAPVDSALHDCFVGKQSALAPAGGSAGEDNGTGGTAGAVRQGCFLRRAGVGRNQPDVRPAVLQNGDPIFEITLIDQGGNAEHHAAAKHRSSVQMGREYDSRAAGSHDRQVCLDKVIGISGKKRDSGAFCRGVQQSAEACCVVLKVLIGVGPSVVLNRFGVMEFRKAVHPHFRDSLIFHNPIEFLRIGILPEQLSGICFHSRITSFCSREFSRPPPWLAARRQFVRFERKSDGCHIGR